MDVLEAIIDLKGNCLSIELCEECPFKSRCLPSFLSRDTRLSNKSRFNLALSAITNATILNENEGVTRG